MNKTDQTKTYNARYVLQRADELIAAAGQRNSRMDRYERMYRMDVYDDAPKGSDDIRLSLPIAYDLVEKMRALLITRAPVISVPWGNADPDAQDTAQRMERYLYGMAGRAHLGRVLADAEWFAMCLGVGVLKVVYDAQAVDGDSPIVIVAPDPRTLYGTLSNSRDKWTELVHVWKRKRKEIIDEWGVDLDMPKTLTAEQEGTWLDVLVEYVEYWREMHTWEEVQPKAVVLKPDSVMEMTTNNLMSAMMGETAGGAMGEEEVGDGANEILAALDEAPVTPDKRRIRHVLHSVVVRDSSKTNALSEGGIVVKKAVIVPGYRMIPYIKWSGIATPLAGENGDLSVLYALANGDSGQKSMGVLQAWNQLASLDMGEALNAANPPLITDDPKAVVNAHAGEITTVAEGKTVKPMREPGSAMAFERMSRQMKDMVDRIGLPEIWSGVTQNLSGQAISGLATAFTMLLGFKQLDRERALEQLFTLALMLTKEYADPDGWRMYGVNANGHDIEETLTPDDIPDWPRVRVKLSASMPKDDMAFISMLVNLVNSDLLSYETALDHIQKTIGLAADTTEEEMERILRSKILFKSEIGQELSKLLAIRTSKRILTNAGEDPAIVDMLIPNPIQQQQQMQQQAQQGAGQLNQQEMFDLPVPSRPPGVVGSRQGMQGRPPMRGGPSPTMGLPPSVLPPSPDLMAGAGRIPGMMNMEAGMDTQGWGQ